MSNNLYRVRMTFYATVEVEAENDDEAIEKARTAVESSDMYEDEIEIVSIKPMDDGENTI